MNGVSIEPLAGGALYILQNRVMPCFSLDSCLLAAFPCLQAQMKVADFCSGGGIIPLLLYLREESLKIYGIELMPEMVKMAQDSVSYNHLQNIEIIHGDVKNCAALLGKDYDLVTCNPPYFPLDKGRVSNDILRAAARSEKFCTLADVVFSASLILKQGGVLAFSILYARSAEAQELLTHAGFAIRKTLTVRDNANAAPWLILFEAVFRKSATAVMQDLIVFDEKRNYTADMKYLCRKWL